MLVVKIDLAEVERSRVEWPFLRDRRVDAYAGLTERFLDSSQATEFASEKSLPPDGTEGANAIAEKTGTGAGSD